MALKGMRKAYVTTLEHFIIQLEHRHRNALNHHINICHANIGANKKNGNGKNTSRRGKTTPIQRGQDDRFKGGKTTRRGKTTPIPSLHKSSLLYAPHVLGKHIAESEEGGGGGRCKRHDILHKCMHACTRRLVAGRQEHDVAGDEERR